MYYRLGRAGRALDRFGVVDFVTTIAPGLRDVLLTGKVYEAFRRRKKDGSPVYDAVVLDAPPTGRISRFLNVNHEVAGLAKVGPVRNQADAIMGVLRSKRTAVHLVTLLEDMPVQETLDAVAQLGAIDLPVGGIVVNQQRSSPLDDVTRKALSDSRLGPRTCDGSPAWRPPDSTTTSPPGLITEGTEHVERLELEERLRESVEEAGRPVYTLPQLDEGIDLGALYELADRLREQGLA